ncbi:MAG: membrane dipeptidase [Planctomycetaceae bacterium]
MQRRTFFQASALAAAGANLVSASADSQVSESNLSVKDRVAQLTANLNPQIEHARQVALSILKPSAAELERGLRLHAESIVFDSYGFSPRAALDGDLLAREIEAGASEHEIDDMREDMSMTRYVTDDAEQREYRDAWRASGVTCVFQNAGQEGQDPMRLIKRLARFTFATDMLKDFVSKAAVPQDIEAAKAAGRHALYMTGNGIPLTQQWNTQEEELSYVKIFFQLGIRMMHLTYQRRNMIGDGCGETSNAGLSDFGRTAIAEMNRIGVIPDCAHSGWQTSLEAAQVSSLPVVASHSTCSALHPHIRSKPDDVIRAIVDSGGYIGICCIPRFLRRTGDITALLDHIDYVVKTFGADHVAIGTDVAYSSQNTAAENRKLPKRGRSREPFRSLWPKDDFPETPEMSTSLAWTNWPLFTVGLVQRGYSDADIRKIIGGNVMRVAKESQSRSPDR